MNDQQQTILTLESRISSYFGNGGLFNPEMMEHDKVRDLIKDCRDALASYKSRIRELEAELQRQVRVMNEAAVFSADCIKNLNEKNEQLQANIAAKDVALEKLLLELSPRSFTNQYEYEAVHQHLKQALSPTVGNDPLERMRRMEEALNTIKENVLECIASPSVMWPNKGWLLETIQQALTKEEK